MNKRIVVRAATRCVLAFSGVAGLGVGSAVVATAGTPAAAAVRAAPASAGHAQFRAPHAWIAFGQRDGGESAS